MKLTARQFIFFLDRVYIFDARQISESFERHVHVLVTHRTENGMLNAFDQTRFIPHVRNHFFNFSDFGFRTVRFENNNHFDHFQLF